jgi:hypothetical protein
LHRTTLVRDACSKKINDVLACSTWDDFEGGIWYVGSIYTQLTRRWGVSFSATTEELTTNIGVALVGIIGVGYEKEVKTSQG